MSPPAFVTRFAPSPTGLLHLGHAFSALTAWAAARAAGGRFLLRIEDIDTERSRPAFAAAIIEDLAWLGLSWDEPLRRQSLHMADYRAALAKLQARGLLYRCFKTRREVLEDIGRAPHQPPLAYTGAPLPSAEESRRVANGEAYAWRLSMATAREAIGGFKDLTFVEDGAGTISANPATAGDVILARKDLGVAYHLAVVVDDAGQGVTHVIRGADLFEAAHIQRLLQALLGLPTPTYRHHRLLLGADGKRLAKRNGAVSLRDLRARDVSAEDVRQQLGF